MNTLNDKPFPGLKSLNKIIVKKNTNFDEVKDEKNCCSGNFSEIIDIENENNNKESAENDKIGLIKEFESLKNDCLCLNCHQTNKTTMFLPCAHYITCTECSVQIKNCPVCGKTVEALVKPFA